MLHSPIQIEGASAEDCVGVALRSQGKKGLGPIISLPLFVTGLEFQRHYEFGSESLWQFGRVAHVSKRRGRVRWVLSDDYLMR